MSGSLNKVSIFDIRHQVLANLERMLLWKLLSEWVKYGEQPIIKNSYYQRKLLPYFFSAHLFWSSN